MDYLDRIARSKEQVTRDLEAFATESATEPAFIDLPLNGLAQFPQEQSNRAAGSAAGARERRTFPIAVLLTAAMIAVAASAAWRGGLIPAYGSKAIDVRARPAAQEANTAPVSADVSAAARAEIAPTVEVRSSSRVPIAPVRPSVALSEVNRAATAPPSPVALSGSAAERRQAVDRNLSTRLDRASSTPLGTSGADRPSPIQRPAVPPIVAPPPPPPPAVAESTAVRSPAPNPALEAPASAAPQPPMTAAAAARPAPEVVTAVAARSEQSEIQRALGQYQTAYARLDADAARAVWPTVDVRALARAFDSLTSQQLAFESCQFNIAGEAATAECRGSATYTPKVGNRDPKLETRQWTFQLRKVDDAWKIQSAQTRR